MRYGIILAAGLQTRFNDEKPKCLWPYDNKQTILEKNVEELNQYVDVVFVVVNKNINNKEIYDVLPTNMFPRPNVKVIEVESGMGTGHAIYETLKIIYHQVPSTDYNMAHDDILLIWGDSIQDEPSIIKQTIYNFNGKCTVPLKFEEDCYMNFMVRNNYIIKAWQPHTKSGLHDFSLFMFDLNYMYVLLDLYHHKHHFENSLHEAFLVNGKRYNTKSGEMNFIDIFNEFGESQFANTVIIDDKNISSINAFNTVEEYNEIINRRKQ